MPTMLLCTRCHESKPEDAFPPSHRQRRNPYCSPCFAAADAEWLEGERMKRLAREAARQEAPPARVDVERVEPIALAPDADEPRAFSPWSAEPAPVDRYARVGHARTPAKADAARVNGKAGGRPRRWSRETLALVAGWIRRELDAGTVHFFNHKEELRNLAQALDAGKVR